MLPLPMNEYVQQNLAAVGIEVEFEVVEWNALINIWRAGAEHEARAAATASTTAYFIQDPFTAFIRHLQSDLVPPAGANWGSYCDPEMDKLFDQVRNTFDPTAQTAAWQKIHEKYRRRGATVLDRARRQPARDEPEGDRASSRPRTGSRTSRRSR